MAHAGTGSKAFALTTLALILLIPCVASAGWGDENWGEMVWGAAAIPVPSLSIKGLITLAVVLAIVPGALMARHRRPSRH